MTSFYYDWFMMCYHNEPPTVTAEQLQAAADGQLLTAEELNLILESKAAK